MSITGPVQCILRCALRHSGKCPICGMDLIPVMSQTREPSESAVNRHPSGDHLATGQQEGSKKRSAKADNVDNSKPRQFFVPIESQQQFGVTYTEARRRHMRLRIRSVWNSGRRPGANLRVCGSHGRLHRRAAGRFTRRTRDRWTALNDHLHSRSTLLRTGIWLVCLKCRKAATSRQHH